jgi:hypothetical protein
MTSVEGVRDELAEVVWDGAVLGGLMLGGVVCFALGYFVGRRR